VKKLVIGLLVTSIHFSAFAEPGKIESVKELIKLINVGSMIGPAYAQAGQLAEEMGKQIGVKASEQEIFDQYMQKMAAAMQEEMSWEKMEGPMIDIYLNNYTEQEIQDMLVFYRSDTGQSLIEKMPNTLSQTIMEDLTPKLKATAEKLSRKPGK